MSEKEFDTLVFIGRFQPYHIGHRSVIQTGLKKADTVLVLVGSPDVPPNVRNPWSFGERQVMIEGDFDQSVIDQGRLRVFPLEDMTYNDDAWILQVQKLVEANASGPKVGLIGHSKDESSYYLALFPQWGSVPARNHKDVDATTIRSVLFASDRSCREYLVNTPLLPDSSKLVIESFSRTHIFGQVRDEQAFVNKYKQQWANSPYPPTFVTVDAVVTQGGHILLGRRGQMPGKGLLALPGGFLDGKEKIVDACIRELREETRIRVPEAVLRNRIVSSEVFDDPFRSLRGRTITHAFHIDLEPRIPLPVVRAGDDMDRASWVPFQEVKSNELFEDHFHIIRKMVHI